jgi:hypothetical protein
MVPVPDSAELFAAATKPRLEPVPVTAMVWPWASVLSGSVEGTFGQVKFRPPAVTVAPGVMPSAARPWAE